MDRIVVVPVQHRFGPFTYDTDQRLLSREGKPVSLVPKLTDTLEVLLEHRGRIVEKAELMRRVWPDTVVEESGLARNISLLRKALGDEEELYIETLPKRGYRFAAEPVALPPPVVDPVRRRWPIAAGAAAMAAVACGIIYWQFFQPGPYLPAGEAAANVAVLPFECLSPDLQPHGFPKAFQEVLTAAVSKVSGVRVLSPSTIARYNETGVPPQIMTRVTSMDVVLEGTVLRVGSNARFTARLADVHTGKVIWASTYERAVQDLPSAQPDVASAIAEGVRPFLTTPKKF